MLLPQFMNTYIGRWMEGTNLENSLPQQGLPPDSNV